VEWQPLSPLNQGFRPAKVEAVTPLDRERVEPQTPRVTRNIILAAIIGLVLLVAAVSCSQGPAKETKERLPPGAMAQMVDGPISAVRERGLAEGDDEFERLIFAEEARGGSNSVRLADLYMAYGVKLYEEWMNRHDDLLLQASRDRIYASIPRYRAAFGPNHPEVALALHSFADVDIELNGEASATAEMALREALQIRRDALGADNAETKATEGRLASISGQGIEARGSGDRIPRVRMPRSPKLR
jgi:hypothetical protein